MQRKILGIFAVVACIVACSKDKFQTKPSLQLKSISSKNIPVQGDMKIVLEFTDKEGDVNDTLYLYKIRINQRTTETIRDSVSFQIPTFPAKSKGDINLDLDYDGYLVSASNPPDALPPATGKESDSLIFRFVLKDRANNTSDTLDITDIVIERE